MEWEHNQLIRQRKAVLATAPAAATGVGPPMPSDAEMKLDWLRRKREEHEVRLRKTMTIRSESQLNPAEPDDAAVKREWLRRKRRDHEAALRRRSTSVCVVPSVVPAVVPSVVPSINEMDVKVEFPRRKLSELEGAPGNDVLSLSSSGWGDSSPGSSREGSFNSRERRRCPQELEEEEEEEGVIAQSQFVSQVSPAPSGSNNQDRAQQELAQELQALEKLDHDEQSSYHLNYGSERYNEIDASKARDTEGVFSAIASAAASSSSNASAENEHPVETSTVGDDVEECFSSGVPAIAHLQQRVPSPRASRPSSAHHRLPFGSPASVLPPVRSSPSRWRPISPLSHMPIPAAPPPSVHGAPPPAPIEAWAAPGDEPSGPSRSGSSCSPSFRLLSSTPGSPQVLRLEDITVLHRR